LDTGVGRLRGGGYNSVENQDNCGALRAHITLGSLDTLNSLGSLWANGSNIALNTLNSLRTLGPGWTHITLGAFGTNWARIAGGALRAWDIQ
jgi:hypothetical protein